MKADTRTLLLGAVAGVLACCVVSASGGAEPPPAAPAPVHETTTSDPPSTKARRGLATVASDRNDSSSRPPDRPRWVVTTTVIPDGTSSLTEATTRMTTTTAVPFTTISSPYSIYDMRYYMDEESLARESSSASASRQFPSYEVNTGGTWRQFTDELTTPSVPYFDERHSDIVAGIEHSIDQVLTSNKRKGMDVTERDEEDNTVEPSHYFSSKPSDVRLDFSNKVEIVYNGTKGPASVRRDLVIINGTHLDLEINRTTVYPIEEFSTISYYELTQPPLEVQQTVNSDSKEVFTLPVTTTDVPGTTDATTNNLRSHVDSSFSANSVQNEITTVSPGEINSTTNNIFNIPENSRPETTTEVPDIVSTTDASFRLKYTFSQKSTNATDIPFAVQKGNEPETTENVDINTVTTTIVYEPSSATSRRPPWVPLKPEVTTTDLQETNDVTSPRSSRGRMMPLNTSNVNRLSTSDVESSGSIVEVLTTESPEENTVYPPQRSSSSPSLLDDRNVSSSTRRKIYTFKNVHTTKITTGPSVFQPSTSAKSTEDNIITVERSPTLNVGLELRNGSAQNDERNEIPNIYNFPPATSRGTIKYTSKTVNNTTKATSVPPTPAVQVVTALKGRGQRLRKPQNTSTTPVVDDEQETSYVRVQTVEKPKNSSQTPLGIEVNRTTTGIRFTPLGPTRIRTVAEDDKNSSEWPNLLSKIYVFPSTTFPPSYNTIDHMGLAGKEIIQNKTSDATEAPNNASSITFPVPDHTSAEETTTEEITTPLLRDVTEPPVTEILNHAFSTPPSTLITPLRTILFPTNIRTFPATTTTTTTKQVAPSTVTWPFRVTSSPVFTAASSPRTAPTNEPVEATESFETTTQMITTILNNAKVTTVPSSIATRTTVMPEGTSSVANVLAGAAVQNEDLNVNGSKPEEEMRHVEGGLAEEESSQHGDGNHLPDINHHSTDWNHRGPNRGEGVHEDTLPPVDDLDYGGGAIGANDLDTVAVNTTVVDTASATVKKDTVTPSSPTSVLNTTTSSATEVTFIPTGKVSAYLLLLTDASWHEVCQITDIFRTAVATLLSQASNKSVQSKQVILLNVSPALCSEVMLKTDMSEKQLVPIEFYFINSDNMFDLQMCQEFRDIWQNHQLQYPYPVRSVELVSTSYIVPNTTAIVSEENSAGTIAAIVISCVGIVSLILLAVLVAVLMRKRQKRFNYGQRCTPVSLDAYSLDSVSVGNSVRRKAMRASKGPMNAPSHPINFAGLANFSSDVAALEEEFGMIPQLSPKVDEVPEGAEAKNRYANVIPLPETRVTLTPMGGEPLSDYINANYVRGPKGVEKFYIASQAPLQSTVMDFWRMVWEHQSKVILMLTDLVEDGKEKCADYLPPSEVTDCHRLFGDFQITLKKREVKDKYIISSLQIKNLETNLWREVTHLWYLGWPAQGVPEEATSLIAFLIEARSYTRANTGPIVAHCSPGTGRTGTVLACDLCIREFEQTRMVDIPRCVSRLRRDRAGAVQTKEQYVFIYQVLNIYATKLTGGALDSL